VLISNSSREIPVKEIMSASTTSATNSRNKERKKEKKKKKGGLKPPHGGSGPTPSPSTSRISMSSSTSSPLVMRAFVFDEGNGATTSLNEHETVFLKDVLLIDLLDDELRLFFASPSIKTLEEKTVLLKFGRELLLEFPWFKDAKDEDTRKLLDELILLVPQILPLVTRVTKVDWISHIKYFLVTVFSMFIGTYEEEKELRMGEQEEVKKAAEPTSSSSSSSTSSSSSSSSALKPSLVQFKLVAGLFAEGLKQECVVCQFVHLNHLLRCLLFEIQRSSYSNNGGEVTADDLFEMYIQAPKLEQSPPLYQSMFRCIRQILACLLREADEAKIRKAKTVLSMIPVTTLQVVLKVGSPIKLMKMLLK